MIIRATPEAFSYPNFSDQKSNCSLEAYQTEYLCRILKSLDKGVKVDTGLKIIMFSLENFACVTVKMPRKGGRQAH